MSRSSTPNTQLWDPISRSSSRRHSSYVSSECSASPPSSRVSRDTQRTQIWSPAAEQHEQRFQKDSTGLSHAQSIDSFNLAPEQAYQWEVSNAWTFFPPRATPLSSSNRPRTQDEPPSPERSSTPNFSRPLWSRTESYPPLVSQSLAETDEGSDSEGSVSAQERSEHSNGLDSLAGAPSSSSAMNSMTSSKASSSRAATMSSYGSSRPLLPESEQRWIPPPPRHTPRGPEPTENQQAQEQRKVLATAPAQPSREPKQSYWTSRDAALPGTVSRPLIKPQSPEKSEQLASTERQWTASSYDTSSLTDKQIAKMKKKGINPALYCEMKAAQRKKGRFGISPLVGNVFLG